ncbi:MAG: lysyl oxidase family protein, partial [Planctomycetota bacterium]
ENWAQFSLREILPGDGIGDIVAQGAKTSFCIIDLEVHDNTLPNFAVRSEFNSCGSIIQGLSVGWIDIYGKYLDGQWIDITNVPPGEYWLESVVDPDDHFVESDETNNAAYVKVTIPSGDSDALEADGYEPNQSLSEAMSYPEGGPKSPNLGPCGPERVVEELSIHAPGEDDYFRFYLPEVGGPNDFVRIDFDHSDGDLDLELFNDVGSFLDSSDSVSDFEEISLAGRSAGWYGVRVFGWNGATNPSYDLTVNPSANDAPTITLLTPPPGDTRRRHGQETYTVDWLAADAEGNDTWVTVYVNESPTFDGKEVLLPTSLHTPGWMGFHIVNSAYFFPGTYYVYASITDGGSFSGAWSDGTITFFDDTFACIADQAEPFGVLNYYDVVGYFDLVAVNDQIADIVDPLGELDFNDVLAMLGVLEAGCGF